MGIARLIRRTVGMLRIWLLLHIRLWLWWVAIAFVSHLCKFLFHPKNCSSSDHHAVESPVNCCNSIVQCVTDVSLPGGGYSEAERVADWRPRRLSWTYDDFWLARILTLWINSKT